MDKLLGELLGGW
jgi:hypothetical protein